MTEREAIDLFYDRCRGPFSSISGAWARGLANGLYIAGLFNSNILVGLLKYVAENTYLE